MGVMAIHIGDITVYVYPGQIGFAWVPRVDHRGHWVWLAMYSPPLSAWATADINACPVCPWAALRGELVYAG